MYFLHYSIMGMFAIIAFLEEIQEISPLFKPWLCILAPVPPKNHSHRIAGAFGRYRSEISTWMPDSLQ